MFKKFKRIVSTDIPLSSVDGEVRSLEDDKLTLLLISQGKIDAHGVQYRNFYCKAFDRACNQLRGLGVTDEGEREDIAQQAGLALIPGRCTFAGKSSPWTWYFIVVTRAWAKWAEGRYAERDVFESEEIISQNIDRASNNDSQEAELEFKRYKACIMDAAYRFARMKRTDRPDDIVILQMLVLNEATIDDVAKRLEISYSATQQRLSRVKAQFQMLARFCAEYL